MRQMRTHTYRCRRSCGKNGCRAGHCLRKVGQIRGITEELKDELAVAGETWGRHEGTREWDEKEGCSAGCQRREAGARL